VARRDEEGDEAPEDRIRRQVGRTLANWAAVILSLGILIGWGVTGIYRLEPGEAAVILFLGEYERTELREGLRWHLPPPLVYADKVNVQELRQESFGPQSGEAGQNEGSLEYAIQTADSNIVKLGFVVQYQVAEPFSYLYGLADPAATLRDAAMSAVREVVGGHSVEGVLYSQRAMIQRQAREILQSTLDAYVAAQDMEPAFDIVSVDLQDVQPPAPVQGAFDDVISAQQDQERAVSEARGDAREIVERAEAEAQELREAAQAYKDSVIVEARGEAERFRALQREYAQAPGVTRRRLYLETMEQVLPEVEKVIVEPDTVSLVPFLGGAGGLRPQAAPRPAPEAGGSGDGRGGQAAPEQGASGSAEGGEEGR